MKVNPNASSISSTTANEVASKKSAAAKKAESAYEAGKADSANAPSTGAVNTEISARAKDMARAKEVASGAPDIREEKIAELKKRIANKEYNVKPEAIADKMVDEHMASARLG
jgi:negative regulator of flagellin synthesis FlgM